MKDEFEANIIIDEYMGNFGWVTEYYINPTNGKYFDDIIKKYEGKKVKIIIQEIE
jgi:hypothetical protein